MPTHVHPPFHCCDPVAALILVCACVDVEACLSDGDAAFTHHMAQPWLLLTFQRSSAPCKQAVCGGRFPFDPCNLVPQVPNQPGLVAQPQPAAISQLVALPTAQQPPPLPSAAAAAAAPTAAAATALPQLSVQTSLKLQTQTPSLQPDLTSQLHHAVSRPLTAQPDNSVWALPPFLTADS